MAKMRKKQTTVVEAKPWPMGVGGSIAKEPADRSVGDELVRRLREVGSYFTEGDQVRPCAILWPDGERMWTGALEVLKERVPELYVLGPYDPASRSGPAVWLRCVEARTLDAVHPECSTPIFYLPGISRAQLREVESVAMELQPLVELQFRGAIWSHPNGKDWTPYAFLSSTHGGLSLDVASDPATAEALQRCLPALLRERMLELTGEKLDAGFLNAILSPDLPLAVLRWMNAPEAIRERKSPPEWEAFCDQCLQEFQLDPERDGPLRAADKLGNRPGTWGKIWRRFAEAPVRYPGVIELLERASPQSDDTLGLDREFWPSFNARDEGMLAKELQALKDRPQDEAIRVIQAMERNHGCRRDWVWREVGRAPLAVALEPLSLLAAGVRKPLAGGDVQSIAGQYAEFGWQIDSAAMAALASGTTPEEDDAISSAVRALYLPWLDASARNLQAATMREPGGIKPRAPVPDAESGRLLYFVDGLRLDVAHRLMGLCRQAGLDADLSWDWSAFPSVTPTAKPAVSPVARLLVGGGPEAEFAPTLAGTSQQLSSDRFQGLLKEQGFQVLDKRMNGDAAGAAWAEYGNLDARGHNEGWKLAKSIEGELKEIVARIAELMTAGWKELLLVTDHGWLLMPAGLPKVSLAHHIAEHRWGRCAAVKWTGSTDMSCLPWHWNPSVTIATPPGAGCFRAGIDYSHGGLSVQEMVIPRIRIRPASTDEGQAKMVAVKWVGLRCRVTVQPVMPGLQVDLRARAADPGSSKVEGGQPRSVGDDGTVSLPVGDDREMGAAGVLVLLAQNGALLHTLPTMIGDSP